MREVLRNVTDLIPMVTPHLAEIAEQLDSPNSRDRLLALASLRDVSSEEAVPLIKKVLDDDLLQIRSMAVFALGIKQTAECYPLLVKILETDPDYGIRANAAGALGYLEDHRAFEPLCRAFYEDTEWLVRFSAAVSLGNLKDPRAKEILLQTLASDEEVMQQAAIAAIGEVGIVEAVPQLLTFVNSPDWLVRQRLAEALGNLPGAQSESALRFLAKDDHPQVSQAAQLALERLQMS